MSRRLLITGGSRDRELILVDLLIVGRDPSCDVSETNDPLLSRRHAAFSSDSKSATVRDLDSRNGILVNGVKAKEARLSPGDVVQIGHLQVSTWTKPAPSLTYRGRTRRPGFSMRPLSSRMTR